MKVKIMIFLIELCISISSALSRTALTFTEWGRIMLEKVKKSRASEIDTNGEESALRTLDKFIDYLCSTDPNTWCTDVVRTKDGRNCMFGHLVVWYYGKDYKGIVTPIWDVFEEMWATTYMIYPVNDGIPQKWMNYKYDQPTPKERVIAYLKNLNSGLEKKTYQLMDQE